MSLAKHLSSIALPRREPIDFERFDFTVKTTHCTLVNPEETKEGEYVDRHHTYSGDIIRVGTSGFEWSTKTIHWVGIDVDHIEGHAPGIGVSDSKLIEARDAAAALPWVEVRRSTGGKGFHFFIYFTEPIPVDRRSDSTKIARAVVDVMSRDIGYDFKPATDKLGCNIWVYASGKDVADNAYEIVSQAPEQFDPKRLPPGWAEAGNDKVAAKYYSGEEVVLSDWHKDFEKHYLEDPHYSLVAAARIL